MFYTRNLTLIMKLCLLGLLPLYLCLGPALATDGDSAREFLQMANSELQDGDYREALRVLDRGLELFPSDAGLEAFVALVEVQRDEEKRRLVERGLSTFFQDPGLSCRTWMRLLQINPDDKDAARNVQVLSEKLEDDILSLESEGESQIEAADWSAARRVARELEEYECLYSRSAPLEEKIDRAYKTWLSKRLAAFELSVRNDRCTEASGLDELVGEPMLSRQQVARAYLLLAACEFSSGRSERAEAPIRNAFNFDPELETPPWLSGDFLDLIEALR